MFKIEIYAGDETWVPASGHFDFILPLYMSKYAAMAASIKLEEQGQETRVVEVEG